MPRRAGDCAGFEGRASSCAVGTLFLIADLAQEPPKEDEDDADTPRRLPQRRCRPHRPADENTSPPELTRVCSDCGDAKAKAAYSKKQWAGKAATAAPAAPASRANRRTGVVHRVLPRDAVLADDQELALRLAHESGVSARGVAHEPGRASARKMEGGEGRSRGASAQTSRRRHHRQKSETPEEEEEEDPETAAPPEDAAVARPKPSASENEGRTLLHYVSHPLNSRRRRVVDAAAGRAPDRAFTEARESWGRRRERPVPRRGPSRRRRPRARRPTITRFGRERGARLLANAEAMPEWPSSRRPRRTMPVLHAAIVAGHDAVAKLLVTRGANANATSARSGRHAPPCRSEHNRPSSPVSSYRSATLASTPSTMKGRRPRIVLPKCAGRGRKSFREIRGCCSGRGRRAPESLVQGRRTRVGPGFVRPSFGRVSQAPKNDAVPQESIGRALQHNRARSLMALGQFLCRWAIGSVFSSWWGRQMPVAADRRAECDEVARTCESSRSSGRA